MNGEKRITDMCEPLKSMDNDVPLISIIGPRGTGGRELFEQIIRRFSPNRNIDTGLVSVSTHDAKFSLYVHESTSMLFSTLINLCKASDFILLTIDAKRGVQLDTFETICLLNTHGLCKLAIVLCNYDNKSTSIIKKKIYGEAVAGIKIYRLDKDFRKIMTKIETFKAQPSILKRNYPYFVYDSQAKGRIKGFLRGGLLAQSFSMFVSGGTVFTSEVTKLENPMVFDRVALDKKSTLLLRNSTGAIYPNLDSTHGHGCRRVKETMSLNEVSVTREHSLLERLSLKLQVSVSKINRIVPGDYIEVCAKNFMPDGFGVVGSCGVRTVIDCRIKRHRYAQRNLRTGCEAWVSIGWATFKTKLIFYTDTGRRFRLLKYIPDDGHCFVRFEGPSYAQSLGVLIFDPTNEGFKIIASGNIVQVGSVKQLYKKLKIVGDPVKIHNKTCFIQNMFSSREEALEFVGAKIQTPSGIRGTIKKEYLDGIVRASFEGPITDNDVVFCKCWIPVGFNTVFTRQMDKSKSEIVSDAVESLVDPVITKILRNVDGMKADLPWKNREILVHNNDSPQNVRDPNFEKLKDTIMLNKSLYVHGQGSLSKIHKLEDQRALGKRKSILKSSLKHKKNI